MKRRIRQHIKEFLESGPKSTDEILNYLNKRSKYGSTTHALGNILSKDADIVKVGKTPKFHESFNKYTNISMWGLR